MEQLKEYEVELQNRELAKSTIRKYLSDISEFLKFAGDRELTKELLIEYKDFLQDRFKVSTVNSRITILNAYLKFLEVDLKLKHEKQQRKTSLDNVMSETDFQRLMRVAESREKIQLKYIMLSLYYTGIRISELQYLTFESLKVGYMEVENKGKRRMVPIAKKLVKELRKYCKEQGTISGIIFRTATGKPIDRANIFKQLKWIAGQARVKKAKVYPHSFRHLFAKQWLKHNNNNVLELANILGHSSLETTRIYATLSVHEQRDTINF